MTKQTIPSCTKVKRYYTIRVSRTVAHLFCLCFIISFCFLLIALPTLDKSRQTGSIDVDLRSGTVEHDDEAMDEPMVVVEYDPAEAARRREEEKRATDAKELEAMARRDAARIEKMDRDRDWVRDDARRERYDERDRKREEPRQERREPVDQVLRKAPAVSGRVKLPNGMKGCTKPSSYGRGYFLDLDADGQLNPACRMAKKEVTRNVRNTTLRSLCSVEELNHISLLNSEQRKTLDAQVLVDDAHKFIYCFVPKVACSNWKRVIKYMNNKVADLETPMKMDHHKDLVLLSDFSEEEVEYRLRNYFKFMFVRDPTERLLSAYRNKFGENIGTYNTKYGPKIIAKYRKPGVKIEGDDQSRITFEEFLRFLVDSDTRKMDPHWRPMHELCQPCSMKYDFIGSFEQLSEDATLVLERVRGSSDAYFPKRQSWYKPTTDDKIARELHNVHPEYMKQLTDKYARDYMLFGYPPPLSDVTRRKTL